MTRCAAMCSVAGHRKVLLMKLTSEEINDVLQSTVVCGAAMGRIATTVVVKLLPPDVFYGKATVMLICESRIFLE